MHIINYCHGIGGDLFVSSFWSRVGTFGFWRGVFPRWILGVVHTGCPQRGRFEIQFDTSLKYKFRKKRSRFWIFANIWLVCVFFWNLVGNPPPQVWVIYPPSVGDIPPILNKRYFHSQGILKCGLEDGVGGVYHPQINAFIYLFFLLRSLLNLEW